MGLLDADLVTDSSPRLLPLILRVVLALFIVASLGIGGYFWWQHHSQAAATRHFEATQVDYLEEQVRNILKDPDSARFRNMTIYHDPPGFKDNPDAPVGPYTLCGEVNAKNAMGGYVGYRDFFSTVFVGGDYKIDHAASSASIDRSDEDSLDKPFIKARLEECKGQSREIAPQSMR